MIDWINYLDIPVPAEQADVDQATANAQLPVPDDVKQLFIEHQGQVPEPGGAPLKNGGSASFGPILAVSPTLPDTSNHTYSVSYAIETLTDWAAPADGKLQFFPFASDTANGWYCLDQRQPDQPIVFIDISYDPLDKDAISPVAATAKELLSKLK